MSIRSEFVTGLYRLSALDTKVRLISVRKRVHARIDDLKQDPERAYALQIAADNVDKILLETSRLSVERLAKLLEESFTEPGAEPPPDPRPSPRRTPPAEAVEEPRAMNAQAPRSHIAAEVVASGGRVATDAADLIIARLRADGWAIVPATGETMAFEALAELDAVLDLPGDPDGAAVFGTQIGIEETTALSHERGVALTNNSVIRRMHRHGVPQGNVFKPPRPAYVRSNRVISEAKPARPASVMPKKQFAAQAPRVAAPTWPSAPVSLRVPTHAGTGRFMEAALGQCRWIAGEPTADAMCFGEPVRPGASYCPGHCNLAYVPIRARHLADQVTNFLNPLRR